MIIRIFQITVILIVFASAAHGAAERVRVDIRVESTVSEDIVFLGNIAEIVGNTKVAERLRTASLGYSPRVGAVRTITLRKIKLVIAATGVPSESFALRAPETVYVRRAGQPVPPELISEKIRSSIRDMFSGKSTDIEIVRLEIPDSNEVPLGELKVDVRFTKIRNLFEPFSLPVDIRVDSRLVSRLAARVEIRAFADVLTAADDIPANVRITKEQLVPQRLRITRPLTEYLTETSDLRGIKSSREIRKGDPMTKTAFLADIVIRNGDRVRITGVSGRLRLVVNGVARASGRIGDRIAVKNLQSNKILQGTITDEGIVEVFF